MRVNLEGVLIRTKTEGGTRDKQYDPKDFSILGIIVFDDTIPKRNKSNFEISKEFYRNLVEHCEKNAEPHYCK